MVDLNIKLPDKFLEEENRCGYTITKQLKELWAVELDLLAEFDRVCKKYSLRYFADGGTLLGAIRDKGFIPWDDDIDLCMFRDDYDKLIEISAKEFGSPYRLQSFYTEKNYFRGHAQLRNSKTTCLIKGEQNNNIRFNQGIFIDIFVLDGVSSSAHELEKENKIITRYKKIAQAKLKIIKAEKIKSKVARLARCLYPISVENCFKKIDNELRKHSVASCEQVAPLNFIFETEKRIRNKHLYDNVIYYPFEFMTIPCPSGYDEFLRNRYSNSYMIPLQIPTTHGGVILDTDHPDSFYLQKGIAAYEKI